MGVILDKIKQRFKTTYLVNMLSGLSTIDDDRFIELELYKKLRDSFPSVVYYTESDKNNIYPNNSAPPAVKVFVPEEHSMITIGDVSYIYDIVNKFYRRVGVTEKYDYVQRMNLVLDQLDNIENDIDPGNPVSIQLVSSSELLTNNDARLTARNVHNVNINTINTSGVYAVTVDNYSEYQNFGLPTSKAGVLSVEAKLDGGTKQEYATATGDLYYRYIINGVYQPWRMIDASRGTFTNTDLNSLVGTPGTYYCVNATNGPITTNCNGWCETVWRDDVGISKQIFTVRDTGVTYIRHWIRDAATLFAWKPVGDDGKSRVLNGTGYGQTAASQVILGWSVNADGLRATVDSTDLGFIVTGEQLYTNRNRTGFDIGNFDLNGVISSGVYHCFYSDSATALGCNAPEGTNGILIHNNINGNAYMAQIYTTWTNNSYTRTKLNGTWKAWERMASIQALRNELATVGNRNLLDGGNIPVGSSMPALKTLNNESLIGSGNISIASGAPRYKYNKYGYVEYGTINFYNDANYLDYGHGIDPYINTSGNIEFFKTNYGGTPMTGLLGPGDKTYSIPNNNYTQFGLTFNIYGW